MEKNRNNDYQTAIEGYKLVFLLHLTADAIHKSREMELKKYGISPEQALALICIYSLKNKATPAEISRWAYREPNSTTILLNRMEKQGLIKKKADTKRKNIIRLSLTKKGIEAYKHAIEFRTFSSIMKVLPDAKKRQELFETLETIREKVFQDLRMDLLPFSYSMDKIVFEPDFAKPESARKPSSEKIVQQALV